jgi:phage tail-like protein
LTFSKITLERGATDDADLLNWFLQTARAFESSGPATQGVGDLDEDLKKHMYIIQQDRNGAELKRWAISSAFCTKFVGGDWDNESDEFTIESAEIDYDWFDLVPVI